MKEMVLMNFSQRKCRKRFSIKWYQFIVNMNTFSYNVNLARQNFPPSHNFKDELYDFKLMNLKFMSAEYVFLN